MGAAMIQPFFRAAYLLALITWDGLEDLSLVFLSPRWASERASEASHVAQPYSRRSSSEQSILPYSHHFNGAELVSRAVRPPQLLPTSLPCRVRPQPHAAPRRRRPCSSLIGAERWAEKQRAASADAVRAHVVRRTDRDTEPLAVDGDLSHYVRARYCASAHHDGIADNALLVDRAGPASSLVRAHVGGGGGGSLFPEQCSNRACVSSSVRVRA